MKRYIPRRRRRRRRWRLSLLLSYQVMMV